MQSAPRPEIASLKELAETAPATPEAYDYRIGRGDMLNIIVYDHPEFTIPAGSERSAEEPGMWCMLTALSSTFYPDVGRVKVAGRTMCC